MEYKEWYYGHYHREKKTDKLEIMFKNFGEFFRASLTGVGDVLNKEGLTVNSLFRYIGKPACFSMRALFCCILA